MGVVFEALDERLERTVALKTMSSLASDETARKRFWREARAAASVNHPNVCQIFEIGDHDGELFIAMELLEGEALGERLRRGPLSVSETLPLTLGILAALQALHARGIVHRDLKPSNVFLTPHGVKLLDFGLARPTEPESGPSLGSGVELTRTGMMVGTPRYMAPEQVTGEALDARSDLFAAGAILFEMLAGRPAFVGRNVVEILHATLYEQPPALTGSPAIAAVDRVIRRALAKSPGDRPASAAAMAEELGAVRSAFGGDTPVLARTLTRLVVLPFRVLRPDPETDFLAFSLPDAISTSLSSMGSLIVRSSATAARHGGEAPDLKAVATEADVDRVVMGTLLRSGDQLRAAAQLVEAPSGTLLTSHTVQSSLGDLFRLQDDIARRVVEALALPLAGGESPAPEAPGNARAYELYLRANELGRAYDTLPQARDLYQRSLELDPSFAPAWAHLGRCQAVIGKYLDGAADTHSLAEQAFQRALELNPRLPVAHKFFAQLEADNGQARQALVRLLGVAKRHGNDAELFAGLVHACRYCGLFEQAVAAHEEARRLDPNVPTSITQTLLMKGDIARLLASPRSTAGGSGDAGIRVIALGLSGRLAEAKQALLDLRPASRIPAFHAWIEYLLAWLERRPAGMTESISTLSALKIQDDPEAIFQEGWLLCDVGEHEQGLQHLQRAVAKGYFVSPTLAGFHHFDVLRSDPTFQRLRAEAEAGRQASLAAFRDAGGDQLLGQ
jgi:serine/threonine protein kinase/tetratricopeptide (TPR) repeat protein